MHGSLDLCDDDGTLERLHHALSVACREKAGREASPTAGIIDARSVRARKRGCAIGPSGRDAGKTIKGKEIKGRKRHILVDTQRLPMHALWSIARRRNLSWR